MKIDLCTRTLLSLVIAFACVAALPVAQAETNASLSKHDRRVEKHLAHYRQGAYVKIEFRDSTQAYGSLGQLTDASFKITNADTNTVETHSYSDVARVEQTREYIGMGSAHDHHIHLWVPIVVGSLLAGGGIAAYEVLH